MGESSITIPKGTTESSLPTTRIWPEPRTNNDFEFRFQPQVESKLFHVDFLKEAIRDFAKPNLFRVEFDFGSLKRSDTSFLSDEALQITSSLIKNVNLPSFEIGRQEVKRMGQRLYLPTIQNNQDIQMTFMCDDDYTPRKMLHSWVKRFVYDTDFNFYKKMKTLFICDMTIYQLDNKFNVYFGVKFEKVFPSTIGEIQLSQDGDAQIVEFPVTFSYSTYTILSNTSDDLSLK